MARAERISRKMDKFSLKMINDAYMNSSYIYFSHVGLCLFDQLNYTATGPLAACCMVPVTEQLVVVAIVILLQYEYI